MLPAGSESRRSLPKWTRPARRRNRPPGRTVSAEGVDPAGAARPRQDQEGVADLDMHVLARHDELRAAQQRDRVAALGYAEVVEGLADELAALGRGECAQRD